MLSKKGDVLDNLGNHTQAISYYDKAHYRTKIYKCIKWKR